MVRDAAESWRGAPLGLGMASVGGLESEFLAPKVTLGTVRWLLFGLPALFRRTGSSRWGWERRICWSGMICLRQRIWDGPLDADTHERERKSSVLSKLKREIKCGKQLKGDREDYDATYFLEGGLNADFFFLSLAVVVGRCSRLKSGSGVCARVSVVRRLRCQRRRRDSRKCEDFTLSTVWAPTTACDNLTSHSVLI